MRCSHALNSVAVSALVFLSVASHLPQVALASGDPEAVADVEPSKQGSTAFIMGDVATLLDAKDMEDDTWMKASALANELAEVPEQPPRKFDFVFSYPSRTRRAVETMFPMSWDVPLAPETVITSFPRRSLRPCHHGHDMMRYADLFSLTRARDENDVAPSWTRPSMEYTTKTFTTWVVCVDVVALLLTVVALVIITVLAMLLLDLCMCCFGVRDSDEDGPETAEASTETRETLLQTDFDSSPGKQAKFADHDGPLVKHHC
jgi:hypothetical protein|tara:strand:+ start:25018 stop:25800 length:783 start_codon:yes stop_codon:yes gene_type:complete